MSDTLFTETIPAMRPGKLQGARWYFRNKIQKRPLLMNLEFTKICNAKCHFCGCWQVESPNELQDYTPVVEKIKPLVVSVSGGEPLLRKNRIELLAQMRKHCQYMMIITNGGLLTEEIADDLWNKAGIDQVTISLDFLGKEHDKVRRIEGLFDHLSALIPRLTAKSYNVVLNTIIMDTNLEHIIPLAHQAKAWGANISYSSFCTLKRDNQGGMIPQHRIVEVERVVNELIRLKRKLKNIKSSNYYLSRVPNYFRSGQVKKCKAGQVFVQVTPDGYLQHCAEMPRVMHYTDFVPGKFPETSCTKCWYACRGETEASHLSPSRLGEILRS